MSPEAAQAGSSSTDAVGRFEVQRSLFGLQLCQDLLECTLTKH